MILVMSCYYCPAVLNGHSVQQNESEKQSLCYCWEKGFFLLQTQISRSFPHDNNKDFIVLTKEQIWCAFRIKNPVHEISDIMTQRAAKPSSREGDSLEVLELGYAVLQKAADPGRHVPNAHGRRALRSTRRCTDCSW